MERPRRFLQSLEQKSFARHRRQPRTLSFPALDHAGRSCVSPCLHERPCAFQWYHESARSYHRESGFRYLCPPARRSVPVWCRLICKEVLRLPLMKPERFAPPTFDLFDSGVRSYAEWRNPTTHLLRAQYRGGHNAHGLSRGNPRCREHGHREQHGNAG